MRLPHDGDEFYSRMRVVTSRISARFGIDRDDLYQEAMVVLLKMPFQPNLANGRSEEECVKRMCQPVAFGTAVTMLRRTMRFPQHMPQDLEANILDVLGVSDSIELIDGLQQSVDEWIDRRRNDWRLDLEMIRAEGKTAWNRGGNRVANPWAKRAGLLRTLTTWSTPQLAVPVLNFVFELPTAKIGELRGLTRDAIYQSNSRFHRAVKRAAQAELLGFERS